MSRQRTPKKPPQGDWHPADIKAALEKAGWSLRRLSLHHGYASGTTLKNALHERWPKAQRLIAEAIGVAPETIWPSRYPEHNAGASGTSLDSRQVRKQRAA